MPRYLILIPLFAIHFTSIAQQYNVSPSFRLKENPAIIEGMTYDPVGKHFYFGESTSKRILKYTQSGKSAGYIDAGKDGLTSVLGMTVEIIKHHIWICGEINKEGKKVMCIFQYNLDNSTLINKYPDTSGKAQLFNDIAVTSDGSVFATDTNTRSIYTLNKENNATTLYLQSDSLRDANGITSNGNILYVSTSRGIVSIDTKIKQITSTPLENFMIAGIDGLYYYKNSLIGIQNVLFPVTIGRYYLDNDGNRIDRAEVMASGHPSFVIPTTGVIVNDDFYFMSNTNIGNENNPEKIKPVDVVRIRIL